MLFDCKHVFVQSSRFMAALMVTQNVQGFAVFICFGS